MIEHCGKKVCLLSSNDDSNHCNCSCESCKFLTVQAGKRRPYRIYSGGYWLQGSNGFGPRSCANTYILPEDQEEADKAIALLTLRGFSEKVSRFIAPYLIQDSPLTGPVHCEGQTCQKYRKDSICGCGCDDCVTLRAACPGPATV